MNFKQISGDINYKQYGGVFRTKKYNNGEFDYWLFVEVINLHDASSENCIQKYSMSISVVSPQSTTTMSKINALKCVGLEHLINKIDTISETDMALYLYEYGIYAPIFNTMGNNIHNLFTIIRSECDRIPVFFGFYMDVPINAVCNTGWDFITGTY